MGVLDRVAKNLGLPDLVKHDFGVGEEATKRWLKDHAAKPLTQLEARRLVPEAAAVAQKVLAEGEGGVIREDLIDAFLGLILRPAEVDELLDLYRDCVSPMHLKLIKVAAAAQALRELGKTESARRLIDNAGAKHGEDARKINNLFGAGYLRSYFAFKRRLLEYEYQRHWSRVFREWFEQQLKFFERAIFINADTAAKDIGGELDKRLLAPSRPPRHDASVYAAGINNVDNAREAIDDWVATHKDFAYWHELGEYAKNVGCHFVVFNRHAGLPFYAKPLNRLWREYRT